MSISGDTKALELEIRVSELEAVQNEVNKELLVTQGNLKKANKDNKALQEQLDQKGSIDNDELAQKNVIRVLKEHYQNELDQLQEELRQVADDRDTVQSTCNEHEDAIRGLESTEADLKARIAELESQCRSAEDTIKNVTRELEDQCAENKKLHDSLASEREIAGELRQTVAVYQKEKGDLEQKLRSMTDCFDAEQKQCEDLRQRLELTGEDSRRLQNRFESEIRELRGKNEKAYTELEVSGGDKWKVIKSKVEDIMRDSDEQRSLIGTLHERCEKLSLSIQHIERADEATVHSLRVKLLEEQECSRERELAVARLADEKQFASEWVDHLRVQSEKILTEREQFYVAQQQQARSLGEMQDALTQLQNEHLAVCSEHKRLRSQLDRQNAAAADQQQRWRSQLDNLQVEFLQVEQMAAKVVLEKKGASSRAVETSHELADVRRSAVELEREHREVLEKLNSTVRDNATLLHLFEELEDASQRFASELQGSFADSSSPESKIHLERSVVSSIGDAERVVRLVVSPSHRHALERIHELVKLSGDRREEILALRAMTEDLRSQAEASSQQLQLNSGDLSAAEKSAQRLQGEVDTWMSKFEEQTTSAREMQATIDRMENELSSARADISSLEAESERLQFELDQQRKRALQHVSELEDEVDQMSSRNDGQFKKYVDLQRRFVSSVQMFSDSCVTWSQLSSRVGEDSQGQQVAIQQLSDHVAGLQRQQAEAFAFIDEILREEQVHRTGLRECYDKLADEYATLAQKHNDLRTQQSALQRDHTRACSDLKRTSEHDLRVSERKLEDAIRAHHAEVERIHDQYRKQMREASSQMEDDMGELRRKIDRVTAEREEDRQRHHDALESLKSRHAEEVDRTKRETRQESDEQHRQQLSELEALKRSHEDFVQLLTKQHREELEQQRSRMRSEYDALRQETNSEFEGLRQKYESEIAALQQRAQSDSTERRTRYEKELEETIHKYETELTDVRRQLRTELENAHAFSEDCHGHLKKIDEEKQHALLLAKHLGEDCDRLRNELMDIKDECRQEVDLLQSDRQRLRQEQEASSDEIRELSRQIRSLTAELDQANSSLQRLEDERSVLLADHDAERGRRQAEMKAVVDRSNDELGAVRSNFMAIERELDTRTADFESIIKELRRDRDAQRDQLTRLVENIRSVQLEIEGERRGLSDISAAHSDTLKQLQSAHKDTEAQLLSAMDSLSSIKKEKEQNERVAKERLEKLHELQREQLDAIADLRAATMELEGQRDDMQGQIERLVREKEQEARGAAERIDRLQKQLSDLEHSNRELSSQVDGYERETEVLKTKESALSHEKAKLEESLHSRLDRIISEQSRLKAESSDREAELLKYSSTMQTLEEELQHERREATEAARIAAEKHQKMNSSWEDKYNGVSTRLSEVEKILDGVRKERDRLADIVEAREAEIQGMQARLEDMSSEQTELRSNADRGAQSANELRINLDRTKTERNELQKQFDELTKNFTTLRQRNQESADEAKKLRDANESLEREGSELRARLQGAHEGGAEFKQRQTQLQQSLEEAMTENGKVKREAANFKDQIKEFADELRSLRQRYGNLQVEFDKFKKDSDLERENMVSVREDMEQYKSDMENKLNNALEAKRLTEEKYSSMSKEGNELEAALASRDAELAEANKKLKQTEQLLREARAQSAEGADDPELLVKSRQLRHTLQDRQQQLPSSRLFKALISKKANALDASDSGESSAKAE